VKKILRAIFCRDLRKGNLQNLTWYLSFQRPPWEWIPCFRYWDRSRPASLEPLIILSPSNLAFWILTAHCLGSVAGMILGVTSKVGRAPTQAVRVVVHWSLRCRQGGTGAGRAEARDFPFFLETHRFFLWQYRKVPSGWTRQDILLRAWILRKIMDECFGHTDRESAFFSI